MALYHLDPRQAGTGATPDVDVWCRLDGGTERTWFYRTTLPDKACGPTTGPYPDEQSALHAAREAAGFGHVAERACQEASWDEGPGGDCYHCGWQRDAHWVQS